MSDEKNSGNTFNINAVPSCIDEPVKAVLNPGANQIGTLFGDLLAMATSKIHFSAEKMRLQQAHDLEEFKKSLSDKLNAKPEECLVEPRMQVVGPAVENGKILHGRATNPKDVSKSACKFCRYKISKSGASFLFGHDCADVSFGR